MDNQIIESKIYDYLSKNIFKSKKYFNNYYVQLEMLLDKISFSIYKKGSKDAHITMWYYSDDNMWELNLHIGNDLCSISSIDRNYNEFNNFYVLMRNLLEIQDMLYLFLDNGKLQDFLNNLIKTCNKNDNREQIFINWLMDNRYYELYEKLNGLFEFDSRSAAYSKYMELYFGLKDYEYATICVKYNYESKNVNIQWIANWHKVFENSNDIDKNIKYMNILKELYDVVNTMPENFWVSLKDYF